MTQQVDFFNLNIIEVKDNLKVKIPIQSYIPNSMRYRTQTKRIVRNLPRFRYSCSEKGKISSNLSDKV